MPRIPAKTLTLIADGKSIDLKKPSKRNFELNKALLDPVKFKEFASDPEAFAAKFDLTIDPNISKALKDRLKGVDSLEAAQRLKHSPDDVSATVWAVASGAYSVASAKVAVAF